jgi:hypothetical protein
MALLTNLRSMCVDAESSFSTPASSAYADYARIPVEGGPTWTPAHELLARPVLANSLGYKYAGTVGAKGGTVTFQTPLPGLSTPAAAATSAVMPEWCSTLLKACAFSETLGTGTTVSGGGSSTTVVNVANASGIAVGSLVLISGEVRAVTATDTSAAPQSITLSHALSVAPADGVVVYASAQYVLGDSAPGTVTIVGKGDGFLYRFKGCKGTVKPRAVAASGDNKRLMLEWTFQVDAWDEVEPTGSVPALSIPASVLAKSSPFFWAGSARVISGLDFNPAVTITAQESTAGENGRAGWVATDADATLQFTAYRASGTDALRVDFASGAERSALAQFGSSAGGAVGIYIHKAQINAYPAEADANGLVTLPVTVRALDPQTATQKPWVLGVL